MRALILNDTRRGGHPGCMLVMRQILQGCLDAGIEVVGMLENHRVLWSHTEKQLGNIDIVILNGEGTLHHDNRGARHLARAAERILQSGKPLALINSVWESNVVVRPLLDAADLIFVRDSLSAGEIVAAGRTASVVPDLVLSCPPDQLFPARQAPASPGPVVVLDDVCWGHARTLARYARRHRLPFLPMAHRPPLHSPRELANWIWLKAMAPGAPTFRLNQMHLIQQASLVVTGRFHGVCLAILAGKPVLALPSNTRKIEGLLKDAHLGPGARLLGGTDFDRAPLEVIDRSVRDLQQAMADPGMASAYVEACASFTALAREEAARMFRAIASLPRERPRNIAADLPKAT